MSDPRRSVLMQNELWALLSQAFGRIKDESELDHEARPKDFDQRVMLAAILQQAQNEIQYHRSVVALIQDDTPSGHQH